MKATGPTSWSDPDHDIMADLRDARDRSRAASYTVAEASSMVMPTSALADLKDIPLPPNSIEISTRDDDA